MRTVNKATIMGTVGKDPDIRNFPSGGKVANFSIATSEKWKDKATGEQKERTQWHRVSVLNPGIVSVVENYVKKGSKVYLEGAIENREWDKDGTKHYITEIVIRPYAGELILLPKADRQQPDTHKGMNKDGDVPNNNVLDDDVPF